MIAHPLSDSITFALKTSGLKNKNLYEKSLRFNELYDDYRFGNGSNQ